ncbi:MAG TPA: hypothetical protein VFC71_04780 [Candidatus Polarisedimenticolia bacterium]|nr:hypothetical protein [Candidatus Polarisedimenticolia bacterium]
MTSNPRTDAVIAAWLDEGPTHLTAAERSEIGDAAELITQRRSIFPLPFVAPRRVAVLATALLVLALALTPLILPALTWPQPTASPSPTPSLSASPVAPSPSPVASACSRATGLPLEWMGRVRTDLSGIPVDCPSASLVDPEDAALGWADIVAIRATSFGPYWRLQLGQVPPLPGDRERDGLVLEYGVVLETTGDDVPDAVIGINDDGAEAGDYRVWVTRLDTNTTTEVLGPPYGYPVEFAHPDERRGEPVETQMVFTFVSGIWPFHYVQDLPLRFYAWASVSRNGEVVAWDYAPDFGWVTPTFE